MDTAVNLGLIAAGALLLAWIAAPLLGLRPAAVDLCCAATFAGLAVASLLMLVQLAGGSEPRQDPVRRFALIVGLGAPIGLYLAAVSLKIRARRVGRDGGRR